MKTILIKPVSEKKGGVMVFFALSLVVLTAMAALALDVSHLYGVKSQLQVAADAAALAGANALTGSSDTVKKNNAFGAATTVAPRNSADVYPPGSANAGQVIPVTLNAGDITCGNWNGTTWSPGGTPLNAVRVVANRLGGANQPTVQNWLINVLSILPGNSNFSQTGVSATAIACRTKLNLVPVAANEHVGGTSTYPNSYMRATNVDGTPGRGGQNFAFFGGAADRNCNPNGGGNNANGFVCLDYRCSRYDGSGNNWYSVSSIGTGTCSDLLTGPTGPPNNGAINSVKHTERSYLDNGLPAGMVPPTAIREPAMNPASDYCSKDPSYYVPALNSLPPYATMPHFSGSGNVPGVDWSGQKLIVMVYDGTAMSQGGLDVVTVVGYGVIQVDTVGPPTWTGHALPHGIPGQDDPYIIQPSVASKKFSCSDVMQILAELQQKYPAAKLVDSTEADMHYGMTTHN